MRTLKDTLAFFPYQYTANPGMTFEAFTPLAFPVIETGTKHIDALDGIAHLVYIQNNSSVDFFFDLFDNTAAVTSVFPTVRVPAGNEETLTFDFPLPLLKNFRANSVRAYTTEDVDYDTYLCVTAVYYSFKDTRVANLIGLNYVHSYHMARDDR